MAIVHKMGQDLSSPEATPGGVIGVSTINATSTSVTVRVVGPMSALEGHIPKQGDGHDDYPYIPANCYVDSARLEPDGDGMGTLIVMCVDQGAADEQITPSEIVYRIDMAEEQTDLIAHPSITASVTSVAICLQWLATEDGKKVDDAGHFQYDNGDGTYTEITDAIALRFCAAWMHGIKTYNRYFPVIDKESVYKRVPGLVFAGASITGGTAEFSADIGKWDNPGITLNGFAATGFFKSKDSWVKTARSAWRRTEQWVWTPDGSASQYGWIYQSSGGGR